MISGRPPLKRIRFVEVPEVASRINGLLSGEYQLACDIPPDQIASIEKNAAFEVQGGTILNHRLTVFDKNHPQLANPLVRRAFTHAIDRQAIVAGPAERGKLIKYALRCGVGASLRALRERSELARNVMAGEAPDDLLGEVALSQTADPSLGISGVHFFTFGDPASSIRWAEEKRAGRHARHGEALAEALT
jgi:hypothetical protein